MATRSVLGLLYAAEAFEEAGCDVAPIMARHGLPMESLDANARIERSKELAVLSDIFALSPQSELGLNVGHHMGLAGYGPLSMLVLACRTTYEACQVGIKYQALAYLFGDIRLELGPRFSALVIEPMPVPALISEYLLLRDMSGTLRFIRDIHKMNDKTIQLSEVTLSIPQPDNKTPYEQAFDCPVKFGQPQNSLVIESHFLKSQFSKGNQIAFEMYREQCDKMLMEASSVDESLSNSLYRYLAMFNYQIPSASEAAQTFGISERTLRRQLKTDNSSYQQVLDQVRFEKAKSWLSSSTRPIEDISGKLGYQEAAAFNHAFKRWSGITPSHYRRSHSNNHSSR